MKIKQIIALVSTVLCTFIGGANGGEEFHSALSPSVAALRLHEGMSFLSARAHLIKSGWAPIPMHTNDHYAYDGAEKRLVKRKFFEVDFCSIDRGALCNLYYAKESVCLRIDTIGEQVDSMRVTGWRESCPSDARQQERDHGQSVDPTPRAPLRSWQST